MRRKYFVGILSVILVLSALAGALPANPAPFTLTQPDGFTFQARQIGDENGHWFETLDGYSITQNPDGYWVYAATNETVLLPAQNKVGKANIKNLNFTKHISPQRIAYEKTRYSTINRIGRIPYSPTTIGTTKAIVILIGFTDVQASSAHSPSYYNDLVFSTSPGANSLANYYKEVSYNQLNITGAISQKWYTSSHTMSYYGADSSTGIDDVNGDISKLAEEAISLAANDINFAQYDGDGDGVVDHVIIIHAGNDQASSHISTDIWSNQQGLNPIYVNGVRIESYTMLAETSPIGGFAHEFGHDIGLPDLYNTETGSSVVYKWDLMDSGIWNNNGDTPAHLSAWSKIQLGWITPITVTAQTAVNISQLETNQNNSVYKISSSNIPSTEYFLVENRQKTGYDSYLPDDGIMIWHIDDSLGSILDNTINNGTIKRVAVEDASNGLIPYLQGAAYSSNHQHTVFSPTSSPNSNSNTGLSTGISIYNIGLSGPSMSVSFSKSAQSVLSVSASPASINVGTTTPFIITVTSSGVLVPGTIVTVGGLISGTYTTNSNGQITLAPNGTWNQPGTINVTATKSGYLNASATITIVGIATTFTLTNGSIELPDSQGRRNTTVTVQLKDPAGNNAGSARAVTFTVSGGTLSASGGTTDADTGQLNVTLSGSTISGSASPIITATVSGLSPSTRSLTVETPQAVMSVSASPAVVYIGTATPFTITVMTDGISVSGATVTLSGTASGTYTTSSTGQIEISPNVPWSYAGIITVTASKSGYASATDSIQISSPVLSVSASPSNISTGTSTSVTFTVTSSGSPVNGATITLSGAGVSSSLITNTNGQATISINPSSAGTIMATATKSGYNSGTATVAVVTNTTPNILPISVVSVQNMGPPVPAGPTIKVTLKANSTDAPVTKLSATLSIINASPIIGGGTMTFDFPGINQSNPLMSGQTISQTLIFISAAYDPNGTYPLLIEGTLQNGQKFSYVIPVMITEGSIIKGDVNGDGSITIVDALFVAQYTVGLRAFNSQQLAAADVNGDGQVTVVDALFIAQYTVGLRQL